MMTLQQLEHCNHTSLGNFDKFILFVDHVAMCKLTEDHCLNLGFGILDPVIDELELYRTGADRHTTHRC